MTKFGGHETFVITLTSGLPLRDLWPWQCILLWFAVFLIKWPLGICKQFFLLMTPLWPLNSAMCYAPATCQALLTKFGGHATFLSRLTTEWPWHIMGSLQNFNFIKTLGTYLPPYLVLGSIRRRSRKYITRKKQTDR